MYKEMIMRIQDALPEEVFKQFSESMYKWNLMCIEQKNENTQSEEQKMKKRRETLDNIFIEYLTTRKRVYNRQYSFEIPPEYNLATNQILSCVVEDKKAYIEVQETVGFKRKLRYTLHKKNDGWRIDKRESFDDVFKNKWESAIL